MSMHLCGPGLTTTSYKKRKQKVTKAQQEELERGWKERNVRLKQMGLSKESFDQYLEWVYGKGKKTKSQKAHRDQDTKAVAATRTKQSAFSDCNNTNSGSNPTHENSVVTGDTGKGRNFWTTGACKTKQTPAYTGTKIIGVAVLHKSCMQPIFSQEEAIDVAHMRR